MPWWLVRFAPHIAIFVIASSAGWVINGWRLHAKIAEIEKKHAIEYAEAVERSREIERSLQTNADKLRKDHDEKVRALNNRVNSLLAELRKRPSRSASKNTAARPSPAGCSGAELYREDSEFLAREAARADLIREGYKQCQQQYETVRKQINK